MAALLLLAPALIGCGDEKNAPSTVTETVAAEPAIPGTSTSTGTGDRAVEEVRAAIRRFFPAFARGEASVCELLTDSARAGVVRDAGGGDCPTAARAAADALPEGAAAGLEAKLARAAIGVTFPADGAAEATVPFPFTGRDSTVRLRRVDGRWLVDALDGGKSVGQSTTTADPPPTTADDPTSGPQLDGRYERLLRAMIPPQVARGCRSAPTVTSEPQGGGLLREIGLACRPYSQTTVSYVLFRRYADALASYTAPRRSGGLRSRGRAGGGTCSQPGNHEVALRDRGSGRTLGYRTCRLVGANLPQFVQLHRGANGTGLVITGTEQDRAWGSLERVMNDAVVTSQVAAG